MEGGGGNMKGNATFHQEKVGRVGYLKHTFFLDWHNLSTHLKRVLDKVITVEII